MDTTATQNQTQGDKMETKEPIQMYQADKAESYHKSGYIKDLEKKIISINAIDSICQKLINTILQLLCKLNPDKKIDEIDYLVNSIANISDLKELKATLKLISIKLKNIFKPTNDTILRIPHEETKEARSINRDAMSKVLFSYKDASPKKFFKIFFALSLLTYTKDTQVIKRINALLDRGDISHSVLTDYVLRNYPYFSFNSPHLGNLYPYAGGKQKFYETINTHFKEVVDSQEISTIIDPFMGGLGTFYSLFTHIPKDTSVILNDLNPSIYTLSKNVQNKNGHKKMMVCISNIIQDMFKQYQTYQPTSEQYKEYHSALLQKLNEIEKNRTAKNTIEGSSILLFLLNNGFGGNYEMKDSGSYISASTDTKKVKRFFNFVGKIGLYHYLYNTAKVTFHNKDYKTILKKYSGHSDTYTTMDPPYFQTNMMSIEEFDKKMEHLNQTLATQTIGTQEYKTTHKEILSLTCGCSFNYGNFGDDFPHEQLLRDLKLIKGELTYFNYRHPLIEKYSKKYGLTIQYLERRTTNSKNTSGTPIQMKEETFMTRRRVKTALCSQNSTQISNNINYINPNSMVQKVS